MATYFENKCTTCGGVAVTDNKTKSFVHMDRGTKHGHDVGRPMVTRIEHSARCKDMGAHDHDAACFERTVVVGKLEVRL